MSRNKVSLALALVVLLQLGVLLGEYLGAVLPLWQGTEVRLQTLPVDPRSLFRGNYAQLRYEISALPAAELGEGNQLRAGERVYIRLERGEQGVHRFVGAALQKPEGGLFIRGRISGPRRGSGATLSVRYGIEAWFAPKEQALRLEKELRGGAVAVVMVDDDGRAALHSLESSK